MKPFKFLLSAFLLLALVFALALLGYLRYLEKPLSIDAPFVYEVKKGSSSNRVISELHHRGVIEYEVPAKIYVRYEQLDSKLKAGEFSIQKGMTLVELFSLLTSNQHVSYKVSLIEGSTFKEARAVLAGDTRLTHALEGLSDKEVLSKISGDKSTELPQKGAFVFTHPEGAIYPDTYFFHKGESDFSILKRAHQRLQKVLDEEWAKRQSKLPLATSYEALILASIVEKETGKPSEREEIAGVFVRRLNKKMRLQTDPTVIYGLGERYKGNITRKHLRELTPYNTYRINGLPPTPIALAGREAIHAALNPLAGKSLYFVAKGDGSHVFSDTLKQHNKAVKEYQLRRRSGYKSTYK